MPRGFYRKILNRNGSINIIGRIHNAVCNGYVITVFPMTLIAPYCVPTAQTTQCSGSSPDDQRMLG